MKVLIVLVVLTVVVLSIVGKIAKASKGNAIKSYEYFKKAPLTNNPGQRVQPIL